MIGVYSTAGWPTLLGHQDVVRRGLPQRNWLTKIGDIDAAMLQSQFYNSTTIQFAMFLQRAALTTWHKTLRDWNKQGANVINIEAAELIEPVNRAWELCSDSNISQCSRLRLVRVANHLQPHAGVKMYLPVVPACTGLYLYYMSDWCLVDVNNGAYSQYIDRPKQLIEFEVGSTLYTMQQPSFQSFSCITSTRPQRFLYINAAVVRKLKESLGLHI